MFFVTVIGLLFADVAVEAATTDAVAAAAITAPGWLAVWLWRAGRLEGRWLLAVGCWMPAAGC